MKKYKRFLAIFLCAFMLLTGNDFTAFAMTDNEAAVATDTDSLADEGFESVEVVNSEDTATDTDAEVTEAVLSYLVVESDYVETPSSIFVACGLEAVEGELENAILHYVNETTGVAYDIEAEKIVDSNILFTLSFNDESLKGEYRLTGLDYVTDGETLSIDFASIDVNAGFGVDTEISVAPDAWFVDEDASDASDVSDVDYIFSDANGEVLSREDVDAAITDAASESDLVNVTDGTGNVVVVLDPGHGGGDAGATRTYGGVTYYERDLNLKIAQACKAELEKYVGITVYMTRYDNSTSRGLTERAQIAKSYNADLFVSIHNNSSTGTTSNGSEVWIPNTSQYNYYAHTTCEEIGKDILTNLASLGLKNLGTKMRNATPVGGEPAETYPTGDISDYYTVINASRRRGIPGMIIEHAFVSNASDVSNFLNADYKLENLGKSDAKAIAGYFNKHYRMGELHLNCEEHNTKTDENLKSEDYGIDVIAHFDDRYKYIYRFTAVNKATGKTEIVSEWTEQNRVKWRPTPGEYTLHVLLASSDGNIMGEQSLEYNVLTDYSKQFIGISGFCYMDREDGLAVGAAYESSDSNVKFKWMAYNLQTQQWTVISDWWNGNWALWKPGKGNYWLHVEAVTSDGNTAEYTYAVAVTKDYRENYLDLNGICYEIRNDEIALGVNYATDMKNVRFRWMSYNLATLQWEEISDWYGANWTTWKPGPGNYWVHVEAITDNGVSSSYTIAFANQKNYRKNYFDITGLCIDMRQDEIALGAGYDTDGTSPEFRWLVYDVNNKTWSEIQNWYGGNWITWRPKRGTYWVHVQGRTKEGLTATYTYAWQIDQGYGDVFRLDDVQVEEEQYGYRIKPKYSKEDTITFRYSIYDIKANSWTTLSDWTTQDSIYWYPDTGSYWVLVEAKSGNGEILSKSIGYNAATYMAIAGTSDMTIARMKAYFLASHTYPEFYKNTDAPTIDDFCLVYMQECQAEGIKPEVAFCQCMKETGFLKFGGDVDISQFNFAGLGATGGGVGGASFPSVRMGVRAHVQHLKAYATSTALTMECVDPRFSLVTRGSAPYVEWLGINENPYGKGWAVALRYGYSLKKDYIMKLLSY